SALTSFKWACRTRDPYFVKSRKTSAPPYANMPAIEAPADIVRIGLLKQSGRLGFRLHVGPDMIVKHHFDAFQAKLASDLVKAACQVVPFMSFQARGRV